MQQLTIRMPEDYLAGLEKIAHSTGLKKSDITRMAIKKYIDEYPMQNAVTPYGKAKDLLGVVASGISDLGQNHRSYMINKIKGNNE